MVIRNTKNLTTGKIIAKRMRKKGFNASVFKVKGGKTKVSVTR